MRKLIWLIIVVVAIIGLTFALQPGQVNGPVQDSSGLDANNEEVVVNSDYVRYPGEEGEMAFTLLQKHAEVDFDQFDFGVFIKSINRVEAPEGYFWKLYINGAEAQVGASELETHEGDVIEWRMEEIVN